MAGYFGRSMSNNAVAAYQAGEMPKSKWTKAAMINCIEDACNLEGRVLLDEIRGLKRDELFEKCFVKTAWHHTSKMYNKTDFYVFDENLIPEISREKTDREHALELSKAEREALERIARREKAERQSRISEADAALYRAHGVRFDTVAGYAFFFPEEIETKTSKKGATILHHIEDDPSAWKEAFGRYYGKPYRDREEVETVLLGWYEREEKES